MVNLVIRNKSFINFISAISIATVLLVTITGKTISVSALAELAPEFAPVFDTQIYQLNDYIEHGGMTDPQLDIFYTLCGLYALGQAGSEDYKLTNPYSTKSGVLNWLKDLGVETYNTLIGLAPDTVRLPDGSIMYTDAFKRAASIYMANLMGCALKAVNYDSFEEFENDIEESEHFFIPWNKDTQYGLNAMYELYGGIYNWQFDSDPFETNVNWLTKDLNSYQNSYDSYFNTYINYPVKGNMYYSYAADGLFNCYFSISQKYDLFINLSNNTAYFVKSNGNKVENLYVPFLAYKTYTRGIVYNDNAYLEFNTINLSNFTYSNLVDFVNQLLNPLSHTSASSENKYYLAYYYYTSSTMNQFIYPYFGDMLNHVYAGQSWIEKSELFNLKNLNFTDSSNNYYVTPLSDDNYLLDIKGILTDILNNINLYGVFIDNLFSLDGVPVHDTDLIRISTDIYDLLNQQNPPIPVNLNDIDLYTSNNYLREIKDRSSKFGETLGDYFVFWHNSDPMTVYVIFGSVIVILIGAFIGKWGHS